jgi:hypothetical protein
LASWRDTASDEAQQQLDGLLGIGLGFAQQQLEKHGEFFPYAAVIESGSDEARMIAAQPSDVGETPASTDVITYLVAALREQRDQISATAVVANVTIPSGDAIRVDLEHAEGQALTILLPYSKRTTDEAVEYGEIRAQAGHRQVWSD